MADGLTDDLLSVADDDPDVKAARAYFEQNINQAQKKAKTEAKEFGILDAMKAGWQGSASGLALRGVLPDTYMPEDPTMAQRLVSGATGMAADLPVMFGGSAIGGVVGSAAGPAGTFVGSAAAGFAAPTFIREMLIDGYTKGDYASAEDLWNRISPTLLKTSKSAALGVVTMGAGKFVKGFASGSRAGAQATERALAEGATAEAAAMRGSFAADAAAYSPAVQMLTGSTAEVMAMTGVGAAMDGRMPQAHEFIDNAILIGGFHGATKIASKLGEIYVKTTRTPEEIQTLAQESPAVKLEVASQDAGIPESLKQFETEPPVAETPAEYQERIKKAIESLNRKPKDNIVSASEATAVDETPAGEKPIIVGGQTVNDRAPYFAARAYDNNFVTINIDPEAKPHIRGDFRKFSADGVTPHIYFERTPSFLLADKKTADNAFKALKPGGLLEAVTGSAGLTAAMISERLAGAGFADIQIERIYQQGEPSGFNVRARKPGGPKLRVKSFIERQPGTDPSHPAPVTELPPEATTVVGSSASEISSDPAKDSRALFPTGNPPVVDATTYSFTPRELKVTAATGFEADRMRLFAEAYDLAKQRGRPQAERLEAGRKAAREAVDFAEKLGPELSTLSELQGRAYAETYRASRDNGVLPENAAKAAKSAATKALSSTAAKQYLKTYRAELERHGDSELATRRAEETLSELMVAEIEPVEPEAEPEVHTEAELRDAYDTGWHQGTVRELSLAERHAMGLAEARLAMQRPPKSLRAQRFDPTGAEVSMDADLTDPTRNKVPVEEHDIRDPDPPDPVLPPADLAEAAIEAKVERGDMPRPKESWQDWFTRVYQKNINSAQKAYQMVKDLSVGKTPAEFNPGILMENFRTHAGISFHWIEKVPTDFKTREALPGVQAYEAILKQVGAVEPLNKERGAVSEFTNFIIAQHVYAKMRGGNAVTGFEFLDAKAIATDPVRMEKYGKMSEARIKYKTALLQYYEDSGMMEPGTAREMTLANPYHVNLFRIFEHNETVGKGKTGQLIKAFEGSVRDIEDPIGSDIKTTHELIRRAELNRVGTSLAILAEPNPENPYMNRAVEGSYADPKGKISVFVDGEKITYDAHPVLAEAWQSMNSQSASLLVKILSAPAMLQRAGFTGTLDFGLRHIVRENLLAPIISEFTSVSDPLSLLPFGRMMQGIGMLWNNPELVRKAEVFGALQGNIAELSRSTLQGEIWSLSKKTALMDRVINVARNPLESAIMGAKAFAQNPFKSVLDLIAGPAHELVRTAGRATAIAEFQKALDAGRGPEEAALLARQVITDNARSGSSDFVRNLNKLTAFQNAGIQGLDQVIRSAAKDPVGAMLKGLIYIGLPTIANYYYSKNDSRYKDAPQWQKDLFWVVPSDKWEPSNEEAAAFYPDDLRKQDDHGGWYVNNGATFRIPKPFEPGIFFGSAIERFFDSVVKDNPKAWEGFDETIFHAVPGAIPSFMQPALEHFANKSMLTGNPVVSHHLEGLMPEYRYTEYTSQTARILGKLASYVPYGEKLGFASPQVVDNYIRGWTGTMGAYATGLVDKALAKAGIVETPVPPVSTLADMPLIRAFIVRHPSAGSAPIEQFYQRYEEATMKFNTLKELASRGDFEAVFKLQNLPYSPEFGAGDAPAGSMDGAVGLPLRLTGIHTSLATLRRLIHGINLDPGIAPLEKRQLIDGYYYQMSQLARTGNEASVAFERAMAGGF